MTNQPMRINHKQLFNLPVYTEEEIFVGYVVGLDINTDDHSITTYHVSKHKLVAELLSSFMRDNALLIAANQVVSISSESMVVKSTSIPADADIALQQPSVNTVAASLHQISNRTIDS